MPAEPFQMEACELAEKVTDKEMLLHEVLIVTAPCIVMQYRDFARSLSRYTTTEIETVKNKRENNA